MPFDLSKEQLSQTEIELAAVLPNAYREAMKSDNGGEISTESCKGYENFPTIAIASNGLGDQLVFF